MTEPTRVDQLFKDDYEIVAFADMPYPYRMAMAWYMAIDGEAWSDVLDGIKNLPQANDDEGLWHAYWKKHVHDHLPAFDEAYGNVRFGIATIPTENIIRSFVGDDVNVQEGIDIDEVRRRYASGGGHYAYADHGPHDRWPVILSSHEGDTLQDGLHRFGAYAGANHPDVPAIFYPEDRHFEWKDLPVPGREPQDHQPSPLVP